MPSYSHQLEVRLDIGDVVKIRHDGTTGLSENNLRLAVKAMLQDSRKAVWSVIDALKRFPSIGHAERDKIINLGKVCFTLHLHRDLDRQKGDIEAIRGVYVRTLNGITNTKVVRIGTLSGATVVGSTAYQDLSTSDRFIPRGEDMTVHKDLETGHFLLSKPVEIDSSQISQPNARLNTFIHEMTHKSAGTADKFYIHYFKKVDVKKQKYFQDKRVTLKNAKINADSYGFFAQKFWEWKNTPTEEVEIGDPFATPE